MFPQLVPCVPAAPWFAPWPSAGPSPYGQVRTILILVLLIIVAIQIGSALPHLLP